MSIFPTKILLATDGSEEAQLALSTAVDIANSTNSELHVVTVGPWSADPAYAVHEASFRWQSLIVMGSRGRDGVRRALMGSVSDSVIRHAHCPVLVVREEKHQAAL